MNITLPLTLKTCAIMLSITGLALADEGRERTENWFNELDADKDGRVSKKEYVDSWNTRFNLQDTNKNKHLDFSEWSAHDRSPSKSVSGKVFARKIFNHWDENGDGQVSLEEYTTFRNSMFDASDTNKDGYWSRRQDDPDSQSDKVE
jgi:Ca2+-binding EF-hand superfamily protein